MVKNTLLILILIFMIIIPSIGVVLLQAELKAFQIYEAIIKIIIGIILFITVYRTNSLNDCTKKEYAFPIAIAFGLDYIISRQYVSLIVFCIYVITGVLDIFETKNED